MIPIYIMWAKNEWWEWNKKDVFHLSISSTVEYHSCVVLVSCCQVRVKGDEVTATVIVFTVQLWRWSCGCWWHQYTCQFKKYGYSAAQFQLFCSRQFHQYLLLILCFVCSATPWMRNTFYFSAECKWQMKSSMYQQGWRVDCIIFDYEFNGSSPP